MGGSSPNTDLLFLTFFLFFFVVVHVSKKKKKLEGGGGWLRSGQSEFFSDFWILFNLTRPLNRRGLTLTLLEITLSIDSSYIHGPNSQF